MPFRREESRVVHYEGEVLDQVGQRGAYSVRAVLYEVAESGRREEVWDHYGNNGLAVSRQLDTEVRRRINERGNRVVIFDRLWSSDTARRPVNRAFEGERQATARRPVEWVMNRADTARNVADMDWQSVAWRATPQHLRMGNDLMDPDPLAWPPVASSHEVAETIRVRSRDADGCAACEEFA